MEISFRTISATGTTGLEILAVRIDDQISAAVHRRPSPVLRYWNGTFRLDEFSITLEHSGEHILPIRCQFFSVFHRSVHL